MSLASSETLAQRTVIVLAAGDGKRMKSSVPKVLHPLLGRSLLGHVLAAAEGAFGSAQPATAGADRSRGPVTRTMVVVGRGADQVRGHLAEIAPQAEPVVQAEQRGTGHAVRVALDAAPDVTGTVIVLNGDIPLLRASTLRGLTAAHDAGRCTATLLTAEVPDPTGLGRIVRAADGSLDAIVEDRDATTEQRAIREINAGAYVFDAGALRAALTKLCTDNDQGEEYLTDVIGVLVGAGSRVGAYRAEDLTDTLGCNDRAELATLRALLRDRINLEWMLAGVTIVDPTTTWIDTTVAIERDAVIEPNSHLRGGTRIGEAAVVGPDTTLIDVSVGERATVLRSHAVGAEIGPEALVGPFAYLRPGSKLARRAKVGTFVETKSVEIGEGAKVPHLSYVGDGSIGEHSNIGAATVFVNYDGVRKHRTVIGRHARTGADNMFVAPVEVGDGAYTAAGSVIIKDVPPGALAVSRGLQRNVDGWVQRRRAGTPAAQAAAEAMQPAEAMQAEAAEAGRAVPGQPESDENRSGGVAPGATAPAGEQ